MILGEVLMCDCFMSDLFEEFGLADFQISVQFWKFIFVLSFGDSVEGGEIFDCYRILRYEILKILS